jgi:hypothetical protein
MTRMLDSLVGRQTITNIESGVESLDTRCAVIGPDPSGLGLQVLVCDSSGTGAPRVEAMREAHRNRLGAKAGIEKRVHPHALRHSMAFDLMRGKVSPCLTSRHRSVTPHWPPRRGTSTTSLRKISWMRCRGVSLRCSNPSLESSNLQVRMVPLRSVGDGARGGGPAVCAQSLPQRPTIHSRKDAPHPATP